MHKAYPGLNWKFEQRNIDEGLLVTFDSPNPDHRPRFLGHTNVKEHYNHFINSAPSQPNMNSLAGPDDDRSLQAFMERMELAADIGKAKSKGVKRAKQAEVVVKRQEMTKQLMRAQRHLGLGPSTTAIGAAGMVPAPIDFTKPPTHPFDQDVIFISIDVEAWERNAGTITEVGVATLDTRDLKDIAPGKNGVDWQKKVRGRHFRIIENKKYVNKEFVQGCPDRFEFGTSEFVGLNSIASELTKCFHHPFSGPEPTHTEAREAQDKRSLILLGHATNEDIQYLSKLGFSVLNRGNLLEVMDTAAMYRSYTQSPNSGSLGSIVSNFEFTPWNLHNAGNDAVYTVWAMLAICVAEATERGSEAKVKRQEQLRVEREEKAVAMARERASDDCEGWEIEPSGEKASPDSGWGEVYTSGGAVLDV